MSVRVRSAGERIVLQVNGKSIGTAMVSGGWTTVTAPVYLPSSFTWGLTPARRTDGGADNPVYVDWLSLTEATAGMTTFGTDIRDASGQKTIPRGVNRNGFEYLANGGGWSSDNDFEGMRRWGATFVRLPLGQQFWVSSSCQYDPAYAARIDQAVQSITSRGMIALVDLHTNFAGKTCGTSGLTPMADQYSIPFWKEVAARYASNPLVAFDLFNEPHWLTDQIWHDGGTVGDYQAVGMQQLYDTVRSTGATNLVFIGGETWAYNIDVALRRPVDGYGIVYSTHLYTDPETDALKVGQDSVVLPVAAQYPVMITEFGSKGHSLYNQNLIDWAEAHGLPWSAWYWYQFPSDYGVLGSFRTYTPSPVGLPVQQGLLKARGWLTPGGGPVAAPGSVFG
jgi:hypothetical protein